ncbi:hypothetical protein ACNKHT_27015 [Shigella flexneri]
MHRHSGTVRAPAAHLGVLTYCFLISDFSVIYVAQHRYSLLSWELKLAAVWGGREGSLLLWVLLLSAWSALFAWLSAANRSAISADASRFISHARRTATVCGAVVRSLHADISTSNRRPQSQSDAATSGLISIRRCFISAMAV